MKSEIYNAIGSMNRGFDMTLESLKLLQEQGVISAEFASDQSTMVQEVSSGINHMVMHKMTAREMEDREHFGKMLEAIEKRRRGEETISGLPTSPPDQDK